MSWNRIAPQSGVAFEMKAGERLEVVDPSGEQVSDLFCASLKDVAEVLSTNRSMDWSDTILLGTGHGLWSNRSRRMMTILEDTCGRHDLLMPPCSLRMFQLVAGNDDYHPSCHENLWKSLAPHGIGEDLVTCSFNLFMNVTFDPDGRVRILPPLSKPGARIVLSAEMDLVVGLTACSHEESNGGACKPIDYRKL